VNLRRVTATIPIAETFFSLQGEGLLVGTPSFFIRTTGCNLRCRWCDTPETSWNPQGEPRAIDALLAEATARPAVRHAVLTGGEPLIAPNVAALADRIVAAGLHLTVETAATVFKPLPATLWSMSPKLASSTPGAEAGRWERRHERDRLRLDTIGQMMASGPYQLKFVVAGPGDLDELHAIVEAVGADRDRVLLMPEGTSVEALDRAASWLAPRCLEEGFRFADRLQIRLYGHTRGT